MRLRQGLVVHVELQATLTILDHHEGPTHADDATGNSGLLCQFLQFLGILLQVQGFEFRRAVLPPEVIGEGFTLCANLAQLLTPQRDQLVLFFRVQWCIVFCHFPCARLQPHLQACFDKFVEIAIQHCTGIAHLYVGAQVLDA